MVHVAPTVGAGTDREHAADVTTTNPFGQFHLEGVVGDPDTVTAVVTLFGEAGGQVQLEFTDPVACRSIMLMLGECAEDLFEAAERGIEAVIERTGQQEPEEPLTVEQILRAARPRRQRRSQRPERSEHPDVDGI